MELTTVGVRNSRILFRGLSVDSDDKVAIIGGFALCRGVSLVVVLSRFMDSRSEWI